MTQMELPMKIQSDHYQHMRDEIARIAHTAPDVKSAIAKDRFVRDAAKSFRWRMCYAAGLSGWICDNIYPYAHDAHIDTALRSIVAELGVA
jgi:hypothetical protein